MKRIKTILKETGAVPAPRHPVENLWRNLLRVVAQRPKGMVSTHMEDYKALLKQSQALAGVQSMNLPL